MSAAKNRELEALTAPVADLFQTFEKVLRAYRLYTTEHTSAEQFERVLFEKLGVYLGENPELTVAVKPYEFLFAGESIYHNTDKLENFSFRFHQDGVRQLTILQGLELEELRRFLFLLRTDFESYENCDDDIVTLLWKAALTHISYVAVETFVEGATEAQDVEVVLREMADLCMQDISPKNLTDILQTGGPALARRIRPNDAEEILNLPEISMGEVNIRPIPLESDDDVIVQRMILVLFRVILAEEDETKFRSISSVIRRIIESLIRLGNFALASKIYGKLRDLGRVETNPSAVNAQLMTRFYEELQDDAIMEELLQITASLECKTLDTFHHLAASLSEPSAPTLFEIFQTVPSRGFREELIPILARLGAGQPDIFSSALRGSDSGLALSILDILVNIGPQKAAQQIKRGFHHSDPRVRVRALDAATLGGFETAKTLLVSALKDPHRTVRVRALHHLSHQKDKSLAKPLFDITRENSFDDRDLEEKRQAFVTLARIGGPALLQMLEDEVRGSLVEISDKATERRIAAVAALLVIGTPPARAVIEEVGQKRLTPKSLKDSCEQALRRWPPEGKHG